MKRIHFGKVFVLCIFLLAAGCSSGQGGGVLSGILGGIGGETSSETPNVPGVGGGAATETPDEGSDPFSAPDEGEAYPPVSLPIPANDGIIISSPDSVQFVVSQATGGMEAEATLEIVNPTELALALAEQNNPSLFARVTRFLNNHAVADTESGCTFEETYRKCVTIKPDGSFDPVEIAYHADRGDVLEFRYWINGQRGEPITDGHLTNVGYTAQPAAGPIALAKNASGDLFQVGPEVNDDGETITTVVSLASSAEGYIPTSGNFETGYSYGQVDDPREGLALNGNEFIYQQDSIVDSFLACTSTDPIFGCLMDSSLANYNSNSVCNAALGCSTNGVKVKTATVAANNRVYYSTEYESALDVGYAKIQELHNDTLSIEIFPDPVLETAYFLSADTLATTPLPTYTGTLAFDTHNNPADGEPQDILVVMRDGSGDLKLIGRWTDDAWYTRPVLMRDLGLDNVLDLEIYQNQSDETDCAAPMTDGSAVILTGNSVEFINYDFKEISCVFPEVFTDSYHLTHNAASSIAISGIIGWTLNDANTRAYVLNPTTITVINLQTKTVINTIALNSLFPGKSITLSPKSILYHQDGDNETVLVGTDELKLILSYDVGE